MAAHQEGVGLWRGNVQPSFLSLLTSRSRSPENDGAASTIRMIVARISEGSSNWLSTRLNDAARRTRKAMVSRPATVGDCLANRSESASTTTDRSGQWTTIVSGPSRTERGARYLHIQTAVTASTPRIAHRCWGLVNKTPTAGVPPATP